MCGKIYIPYVDMHFEMHITAFRGLLDAALCTKKQEKTIRSAERDAPSDQEGRQHHRGAARGESRAREGQADRENRRQARRAIRAWALGQGYNDWDGDANNYQRWRDGVMAKFNRQTKGLDDGGPPEDSSLPPPSPPLPSSAASNKAKRTPPAAQASSERQPSTIRQRVLLPPSVGEERDEPIPQARPPLNKPYM